jgi:hypothetical protein
VLFREEEEALRPENAELLVRVAEKVARVSRPKAVAVGYWGVMNRNTATKNIGQALLSGALGMGAPFLVRSGAEYVGNLGLIALHQDDLVYVDLGIALLAGSGLSNLQITQDHLELLLDRPSSPSNQRYGLPDISARAEKTSLALSGSLEVKLFAVQSTVDPRQLARELNGMAGFPPPGLLLAKYLRSDGTPKDWNEPALASNASYSRDVIDALMNLGQAKQRELIPKLRELPGLAPTAEEYRNTASPRRSTPKSSSDDVMCDTIGSDFKLLD